jgi:hypothetical protein
LLHGLMIRVTGYFEEIEYVEELEKKGWFGQNKERKQGVRRMKVGSITCNKIQEVDLYVYIRIDWIHIRDV